MGNMTSFEFFIEIIISSVFVYWLKYTIDNKKGIGYKAFVLFMLIDNIECLVESFYGGLNYYIKAIVYGVEGILLLIVLWRLISRVIILIKKSKKPSETLKFEYKQKNSIW